jgi:hypothetical protein
MWISIAILAAVLAFFLIPPLIEVVRLNREGWDDLQNGALGGRERTVPHVDNADVRDLTHANLDVLRSVGPAEASVKGPDS